MILWQLLLWRLSEKHFRSLLLKMLYIMDLLYVLDWWNCTLWILRGLIGSAVNMSSTCQQQAKMLKNFKDMGICCIFRDSFYVRVIPYDDPEKNPKNFLSFIGFLNSWGWEEYNAQNVKSMHGSILSFALKFSTFQAIFWQILIYCALLLVARNFEMPQHLKFPTNLREWYSPCLHVMNRSSLHSIFFFIEKPILCLDPKYPFAHVV